MRKLILAMILMMFTGTLSAANHYILASATGADDGTDWTNAWTDMRTEITSFTRGDTYYIGDGSYLTPLFPGFDDAESGTTLITIQKATVADHGTETGWMASFANQASVNGGWLFDTAYWVVTGVTRDESNWDDSTAYGFKTGPPSNCNQAGLLAQMNNPLSGNVTMSYIAFLHCEGGENFKFEIINSGQAKTNITISRNLLSGGNQQHRMGAWSNSTVEYNYYRNNDSPICCHGAAITTLGNGSDNTIRYNVFEGSQGTASIGYSQGGGTGNKIYGNAFFDGSVGNGTVADTNNSDMRNVEFYNNTMVNMGGRCGVWAAQAASTGNVSRNNMYYGCTVTPNQTAHDRDFEAYHNTSGAPGGDPNSTISGSDPFVNLATDDYHLSAATANGTSLAAEFNTDVDGITRGVDLIWDRGAYEFKETVVLTGTLSDGATEAEIVSGGQTLIMTLTGDTWVATVGDDNAITQALIDGISSAQSEANGWNIRVRDALLFGDVTRDSSTQVTVLLPAYGSYNITSNESLTATVPASALVTSSTAIIATPGFITVTVVGSSLAMTITGTVTSIFDSTSFLPSTIEVGDFINGSFCYTTTSTDQNSDAEFGVYRTSVSPDTVTLTVEGNTWQPSSGFNIETNVRNGTDSDIISVGIRGISFPSGFPTQSTNKNSSFMKFQLTDDTAAVLTDDTLPTGLTLANWSHGLMEIVALVPGGYYRIVAETILTLVEP